MLRIRVGTLSKTPYRMRFVEDTDRVSWPRVLLVIRVHIQHAPRLYGQNIPYVHLGHSL